MDSLGSLFNWQLWCSWLSRSPHTREVPGSNPGSCIFCIRMEEVSSKSSQLGYDVAAHRLPDSQVLLLLLLQQLLTRQDHLVNEQLSQLVCDCIVSLPLLLLLRTPNYPFNLQSFTLQGGLSFALVCAKRAFVLTRSVVLPYRGLPSLDWSKMRLFRSGSLFALWLKQSVLDSPKLKDRCIFNLIDLNAIRVFAKFEQSILYMRGFTLTMRLLIRASQNLVIFLAISTQFWRTSSCSRRSFPSFSVSMILQSARISSSLIVSRYRKNSASICLSKDITPFLKISQGRWPWVRFAKIVCIFIGCCSSNGGTPSINSFSFLTIQATFIDRIMVSFSRYSWFSSTFSSLWRRCD